MTTPTCCPYSRTVSIDVKLRKGPNDYDLLATFPACMKCGRQIGPLKHEKGSILTDAQFFQSKRLGLYVLEPDSDGGLRPYINPFLRTKLGLEILRKKGVAVEIEDQKPEEILADSEEMPATGFDRAAGE